MNYKKLIICTVIFFAFQSFIQIPKIDAKEQQPKILMVYMTEDDLPTANIHFWEATFSAFTNELQLIAAKQIDSIAAEKKDVVVFIGEERGMVPKSFQVYLQQFEGRVIAFGNNVEQLQPYKDWRFGGQKQLRTLDDMPLSAVLFAQEFILPKQHEVLSVGSTLYEEVPFIGKAGKHTYIASTSIGMAEKLAVSRSIYQMLNIAPPAEYLAYIRLEDISPISNPQLIQEAGNYLIEREIPFYLIVNPVYINSETKTQLILAENKELVEVLLDLQKRGGIIISSADYSDGEGEFKDVKLNPKNASVKHGEQSLLLNSSTAFSSQKSYELYLEEVDEIEQEYINQKLTKTIEDLVELGLHPLAFKPAHYAMTSNGYLVSSTYFTSIFGQLQLSDDNLEVTNIPLFLSTPAIAAGMVLYPETIGFVDPKLEDPLGEMKIAIEQLKEVPGAMIGGSYPSYIGLDYLPKMVDLIESVGNIKWIDLRQTEQITQTEQIIIRQERGKILEVTSTISHMNVIFRQFKRQPFEASLWMMAIVVGLFILAFFIYISRLRVRLRKRLFEEREQIG